MDKALLKTVHVKTQKCGVKAVFAFLIVLFSAMLMQSCVFAYTGSGSKTNPYMITTGEELVELVKTLQNETAKEEA